MGRRRPPPPHHQHVWLIANPYAGVKGGVRINPATPEAARAALLRQGIDARLALIRAAGDAERLARQAVAAGAELVVAAGGDGTASDVAAGLVGSGVPLALMPLGSLMNVHRALDVPRRLDGAARVIRAGRLAQMEVGEVFASGRRRHFIAAAGAGLSGSILAYAQRLDAGDWRALAPLLGTLRRIRRRPLLLTVDGRTERLRAVMVTVAIAPEAGLGVPVAPGARIDDGRFEIVVRERIHPVHTLWQAARLLLLGRRPRGVGARRRHGRAVEVVSPGRPLVVHADGHVVGLTPARFVLLPAFLPVIVGPRGMTTPPLDVVY